jgi:hypothetical protein
MCYFTGKAKLRGVCTFFSFSSCFYSAVIKHSTFVFDL